MSNKKLKIIGIIPARYESTRFPGKPLVKINGKPMIQWTYENTVKCNKLDAVIVATDDMRIFEFCASKNIPVKMTATHHQSGTDRCNEVLNILSDNTINSVINIQGDEPLINPKQINQLIEVLKQPHVEIATLIKKIEDSKEIDDPNKVKVVVDANKKALYFSRSRIPNNRNCNKNTIYFKHIGMYGYKTDTLNKICTLQPSSLERSESLEQLRWLENGYKITTGITEIENTGVDSPADLEKIKKLLNKK